MPCAGLNADGVESGAAPQTQGRISNVGGRKSDVNFEYVWPMGTKKYELKYKDGAATGFWFYGQTYWFSSKQERGTCEFTVQHVHPPH